MTFLNDCELASFSSLLKKKEPKKKNRVLSAANLGKAAATGALGAASLGTAIQLAAGNRPTPRWLVNAMKKGRFGKDIAKQADKIPVVGKTKSGKPIYEAINEGHAATSTAGTRAMIAAAGGISGTKLTLDKIKQLKEKSKRKK